MLDSLVWAKGSGPVFSLSISVPTPIWHALCPPPSPRRSVREVLTVEGLPLLQFAYPPRVPGPSFFSFALPVLIVGDPLLAGLSYYVPNQSIWCLGMWSFFLPAGTLPHISFPFSPCEWPPWAPRLHGKFARLQSLKCVVPSSALRDCFTLSYTDTFFLHGRTVAP